MSAFKEAVQEWTAKAEPGAGLRDWIEGLCELLKAHEAEFQALDYSYRLCATDTGLVCAFALTEGRYVPKTEMDEADVIVSGKERDLLDVLQRKLSPMSALLRGKVQLKGSKTALIRLSEYL